jgi:hypothetical protein
VRITAGVVRSIQDQLFPVADARRELDAQEVGRTEPGRILPLGIGVERVGLDVARILQQPIENGHSSPYTARDGVAGQSNVGVRHVTVANATTAAVADAILREQVLFVEIPLGAVRRRVSSRAPGFWDMELITGVMSTVTA